MHNANYAVARCQCVCSSALLIETAKHIIKLFHHQVDQVTQLCALQPHHSSFTHQTVWQNSDGYEKFAINIVVCRAVSQQAAAADCLSSAVCVISSHRNINAPELDYHDSL